MVKTLKTRTAAFLAAVAAFGAAQMAQAEDSSSQKVEKTFVEQGAETVSFGFETLLGSVSYPVFYLARSAADLTGGLVDGIGSALGEVGYMVGDDVVLPTVAGAIHNASNIAQTGVNTALNFTQDTMNAVTDTAARTIETSGQALSGNIEQAGRNVAGAFVKNTTAIGASAIDNTSMAVAGVVEGGLNTITDTTVNLSKPAVNTLANLGEYNPNNKDAKELENTIKASPDVLNNLGKAANAAVADAIRIGGTATRTVLNVAANTTDASIREQGVDMVVDALPKLKKTGEAIGSDIVDAATKANELLNNAGRIKNADEAIRFAKGVRDAEEDSALKALNHLIDVEEIVYNSNENARRGLLDGLAISGTKVEPVEKANEENLQKQLGKEVVTALLTATKGK